MVMFGGDNRLFAIFEVDVLDEALDQTIDKMGMAQNRAQDLAQSFQMVGQGSSQANDDIDDTNQQFGKMFGIGMNVLFLGMALNMVFGRMARNMLSMTGASAALSAGLQSVLLPFFIAITPMVLKLSQAMMNLPDSIKFAIGAIVATIAVVAPLMMMFGQLALIVGTTSLSFAALGAIIGSLLLVVSSIALAFFFMQKAMKGVQPVISALAAIVVGTLLPVISPILGAAVMLAGLFTGLIGIFKKFGNVIGTIVTAAIVIIGGLVAAFVSVPAGIAIAIVAIIAAVWSLKDEIGAAINKTIGYVKELSFGFANWLGKAKNTTKNWVKEVARLFLFTLPQKTGSGIRKLLGFFKGLGNRIISASQGMFSAGLTIAEDLIDGMVNGIKTGADMILDALTSALPDWAVNLAQQSMSGLASGFNAVGDVVSVNDFILSDGKLIQPDKRDTIIGGKPGGPIAESAGGGNVTVNINDPVMKEDVDVQRVVDEVEDRVNRDTRGRSGGIL